MKKVSVIIAAYNVEKYIVDCLKSVLNQTYSNLQIIIVNDGSYDKTLDICNSFVDSRINIITQTNKGLSSARNTGLEQVDGEYFLFVDGDDVLDLNAIEILVSMLEEFNADISVCGYEKFNDYYNNCVYDKTQNMCYSSKNYLKEILLFKKNSYAWGTLIKSKYKSLLKFPENDFYEDMGTMYKLFEKVNKIVFNPVKLVKYRQNNQSIVHTYSKKKVDDYVKYGIQMCESIKSIYPEFSNQCNTFICYVYIAAIYMVMYNDNNLLKFYKNKVKQYNRTIVTKDIPKLIKIKLLIFKYSVFCGCLVLKLKRGVVK